MVREPGRPGKENNGDQLHPQEIDIPRSIIFAKGRGDNRRGLFAFLYDRDHKASRIRFVVFECDE